VREGWLAFEFEEGIWTYLGEAREVERSQARQDILRVVGKAPGPMTPAAIARELGKHPTTVRRLLQKLHHAGEVKSPAPGYYVLASLSSLSSPSTLSHAQKSVNVVNAVNTVNTVNTVNDREGRAPDNTNQINGIEAHEPSVHSVHAPPAGVNAEKTNDPKVIDGSVHSVHRGHDERSPVDVNALGSRPSVHHVYSVHTKPWIYPQPRTGEGA
jgi:hypothetical protein